MKKSKFFEKKKKVQKNMREKSEKVSFVKTICQKNITHRKAKKKKRVSFHFSKKYEKNKIKRISLKRCTESSKKNKIFNKRVGKVQKSFLKAKK